MSRRPYALLFIVCIAACVTGQFVRADDAPRPNILFAIADDWGYGHASAYGCDWTKTPAFDRVARDGLLFTRAYTPNAKCAPSRACVITGRNSWQLKEAANHVCFFPPEFKSWCEALGENGYSVGYTGKGWGPGVAKDADGIPRQLTGRAYHGKQTKPLTNAISRNDYAGNFASFLDTVSDDQPWSFWYGATEPHRGYEYGSGVKKAGKSLDQIDHVPAYWPDNETVRNDMLDYAVEVEHVDAHLGRMLADLEDRGLLENTIVVVTSDHGMPFPRVKGNAYDHANRVPMAIMWPTGIAAPGRIVDDYISFIDLGPTFLELAGVDWDAAGMAPSPGKSLTNIFASTESGRVDEARNHVLIGQERHDVGRPNDEGYPIRGIVKNDWLYLQNFEPIRWPACDPETGYLNCDGGATKTVILQRRRENGTDKFWDLCFGKRPGEQLYDLIRDPDCINNLADDEDATPVRLELKEQLYAELREQEDPRMNGRGHLFDAYEYAHPAQRNFYERFMNGEELNAGWVNESDFEPAPIER